MSRIIVCVTVPSIEESYDISIDSEMKINDLVGLLRKVIKDASDNRYVSSGKELLCSKTSNCILYGEKTVRYYGVKNGDQLVIL